LGRKKQALAAAVQNEDFSFGINRAGQVESAGQPACGRPPKRLDAPRHGVTAELGGILGQHRSDKTWHGMLRLT